MHYTDELSIADQ